MINHYTINNLDHELPDQPWLLPFTDLLILLITTIVLKISLGSFTPEKINLEQNFIASNNFNKEIVWQKSFSTHEINNNNSFKFNEDLSTILKSFESGDVIVSTKGENSELNTASTLILSQLIDAGISLDRLYLTKNYVGAKKNLLPSSQIDIIISRNKISDVGL